MAERQEQTRRVHANQRLGTQVENLVRENLEDEGFSVTRTGTGSDFEIRLDITQDDKSWLIEVKSTQKILQSVRMSSTQAQTAKKKRERFLLCVVPIGQGSMNVDPETVREKMRFIANIDDRVAPLCKNIDRLEEIRADITADASSDVELKLREVKQAFS